ncbi:hypothetical protein HDU67_006476 [Dinochytrium kinnereticum]|nr:hypothetical protein HDU67_006476 [Dinochytrium kinnereticum]
MSNPPSGVLQKRHGSSGPRFGDPVILFFRRLFVLQLGLTIYLSYKIVQVWLNMTTSKEQREDPNAHKEIWDNVHERNAKRAYNAIVGLQGLWIKGLFLPDYSLLTPSSAGQYLSTRADVMPEPYVRLLRTLQDQVPSKPIDITVSTICSELQIESLNEVFEEFDGNPLATASIAQVHRATLKPKEGPNGYPGGPVVVKVQHANIQKRVIQDLQDLRVIIRLVGRFEPNYDFTPIVEEWSNEVPKELDFMIEARNTMEIRDAIAAHNENGDYQPTNPLFVDCGFADPLPALVTEKVMVMTYIDGYKIMDREGLQKENVDMADIVINVIKAYAFQIYVLGFWNSDPHPGNFLVAKKPDTNKFVPILLDFGLTKRATKTEVIGLSRILLSAQSMDLAGLMSGLQEIGIGGAAEANPERSMDIIQFIFRKTSSIEESKAEVEEKRREQRELEKEEKEKKKEEIKSQKEKPITKRPADAIPGVLVFFSRVVALLRGLCVSLDTRVEYLGTMAPFARHYLENSTADCRMGLLDSENLVPLSSTEEKVQSVIRAAIGRGDVLGIQVVVFKNGKLVVDTAAGVLGLFDPRPVEKDSLFPVFSCTKAITAAACHLLIQRGKLKLSDTVASHWPEFASGVEDPVVRHVKSRITVADLLSHRSGLADAGAEHLQTDAFKMADFDAMIKAMEIAKPTSPPGETTSYHYLSFGWLVGGLVQKVAGKLFAEFAREMLDEMGVGGYGYIGIPPGVETRLAALHWDAMELRSLIASQLGFLAGSTDIMGLLNDLSGDGSGVGGGHASPESASNSGIMGQMRAAVGRSAMSQQVAARMRNVRLNPMLSNPTFFNHLRIRRSVIPAASGNFSARGLALFYAHLLASESPPSPPTSIAPGLAPVPTFPLKNLPSPIPPKEKRKLQKKRPSAASLASTATAQATGQVAATNDPPLLRASVVSNAATLKGEPIPTVPFVPVFEPKTVLTLRTVTHSVHPDDLDGNGNPLPGTQFTAGYHRYRFDMPDDSAGGGAAGSPPVVISAPSPSDPTLSVRDVRPSKRTTYAYGHSGMGGSFALAHPESGVAVAVVISKISLVDSAIGREVLKVIAGDLGMGEVVGFGMDGGRAGGEGGDEKVDYARDVTMNPFR